MMTLTQDDWTAITLTLQLASIVTTILLIISTPLAWWLARSHRWWKAPVNALVAMPLVLPPTVLGFYLLVAMGPAGPIGHFTAFFGMNGLAFSFWGLVIGSCLYSLPFVVQPIQNAFQAMGNRPLEVASTLGAGPIDRFFSVIFPLCKPGFITGAILGFAHTVGEFGVVLMIGGNIPGETRVVSVQLYDHVESLQYDSAHGLALILILFAFFTLTGLFIVQRRQQTGMIVQE
ncbi:molybdate ABC transporter permease subunit [Marinibactrum halimedae]|uniref:Molybdenum transport system permease n=1 Tax=Marinibactrum halimedae TaxID=1444977 RepID=A0AA37T5X4_9GAMM|nr:molybdate ABC transporter permease subunit [Marinibactrum halimedae]MCD9461265.1 molybdate ABC transporter permease subunit [Marinibactrum halimedae]GLS26199.1 molybdenum ABC transporter permease subunit [Marinibactrum halimedae]